jgi:Putative zinc-finger
MKDNCLDIGIIQAFLDSELSLDETARVSTHIADCDSCAMMLAEAEEESALVFPVLERELDTLVPTQRLWNKINDSIKIERENRPIWEKAWAFIRVSLASPSMVAAASLLIVFGLFAGLWINKNRTIENTPMTAGVAPKQPQTTAPTVLPVVSTPVEPDEEEPAANDSAPRVERAVYRPEVRRQSIAVPTAGESNAAAVPGFMPGEESYVKTIATLNRTVDEQKSGIMRASELIAYERDMAVVNDTISKMRNEVRRNPKNESAKQLLYASYQNKIDLLNSVAQKEELVASLK